MNWRAVLQYLSLIGFNNVQLQIVNRITGGANWGVLVSFVLIDITLRAYIELLVGGILFRPNADNVHTFQIKGLVWQYNWPLHNRDAWRLDYWDLNYYTVLLGTYSVSYYF